MPSNDVAFWHCQVPLVLHRSCFQLCHEVARARQLLAETTSAAVTSQMLGDACQENLGAGRALSYFKTVSAVLRKMFAVPDIYNVLFEADSPQGLRIGWQRV